MAITDIPTKGERRGSNEGNCDCTKARDPCDRSPETPRAALTPQTISQGSDGAKWHH